MVDGPESAYRVRMPEDFEPFDFEIDEVEEEAWLAALEQVDRDAAGILRRALPWMWDEVHPPVSPSGPLDQALRRAASGDPTCTSLRRAIDEVPADAVDVVKWAAALEATFAPEPDWEAVDSDEDALAGDDDGTAAVLALQHADWLAIVLGLVRRGVGAEFTGEGVLRDLEEMDEVEGANEDPEGDLSVLDTAVEVLAPQWQVLGVLDDERRLTELGRWGLPRVLHDYWAGERRLVPDYEPIDPETEKAALTILAREPLTFEDLRKQLARDSMVVDLERLRRSLIAHRDIFALDDDTLGHVPTLAEGVVLTHRISQGEVETGALGSSIDLDAWDLLADVKTPLAAGGNLRLGRPERGDQVPDGRTSAFYGPEGWLDGFAAGDLVGLRYRGGQIAVEHVDDEEISADSEAVRALGAMARRCAEYDAAHGDPDFPGVMGSQIVFSMRRAHPESLTRPLPPLSDVVAGEGLETHGDVFVGLPGTPWWGEPEWFTEEERATWSSWKTTLTGFRRTGKVPADTDWPALANGLRDRLLPLVAVEVTDDPEIDPVLEAMQAATDGLLLSVPAYLRARAAEARGDGPAWRSFLEAAAIADPENQEAVADLADLKFIVGDAHEAERLYKLAGLEPSSDELTMLRRFLQPPEGEVGRNKPCPCGSGKKYKLCHGRTAVHPLTARAPWLWHKILGFTQRPAQRSELLQWGAVLAGTEPDERPAILKAMGDPVAADFALFDGGLFEEFLEFHGDLLPGDERELAESWLHSGRRLMEVIEVKPMRGIVVRDLVLEEELEILDRAITRQIQPKDLLFGRPLDDGAGDLRFQDDPQLIPRMMRGPLLERLRHGVDGDELAAFFAPTRPQLQTTEGQEMVFCTARYEVADLDDTWSALAEQLEEHGDELVVLGPNDVVRGRLLRRDGRLVIETNSVERLRGLQKVVLAADPAARLVDESTRPVADVQAEHADALPELGGEQPELTPEVMAQVAEQFEQRWLADSIPALGGLTPREAAASPEMRPELEALLDDFAWTQQRNPSPFDMDLDRVRRELGLAGSES